MTTFPLFVLCLSLATFAAVQGALIAHDLDTTNARLTAMETAWCNERVGYEWESTIECLEYLHR